MICWPISGACDEQKRKPEAREARSQNGKQTLFGYSGFWLPWLLASFLVVAPSFMGQITIQDLRTGLRDPSRWLMYSGDYTSQRHSPLTQITPANVNRLTPQWTFQTDLSQF